MENQPQKRVDQVSRTIQVSAERVYQAILDSESLAAWLPPTGMTAHIDRYEPWEGGAFRITLAYSNEQYAESGKTSENKDVTKGFFRQVIPGQLIVWEAGFDSKDTALREPILMSWRLNPLANETTEITIVAENVPAAINEQDHLDGLNSTLENLEAYLIR